MGRPLISVIVPVYNGSNYIAEALDCLIHQTYSNIEIIVINDGSTDGGKTAEAVKPFLSDPRVIYVEKENGGVSTALNYGLEHMNGEFFSWLSHDDLIDYSSIEKRFNFWTKLGSDNKTIISTVADYIDINGDKILRIAAKSKDVNNIADILSSTINGCSLLIPASLIKNHKFKEGMVFMQDYYLWATLITEGAKIKCLNKTLTHNRIHDGQVSANKYDLLIRDFDDFAKTFIDPLLENGDYDQIRNICFTLEAHLSTRPFYKPYLDKYVQFLKDNNKWQKSDEKHAKRERFVSWAVSKTRKPIVIPEPNNVVKKIIFVGDTYIENFNEVWDDFSTNNPNIDFKFLFTKKTESKSNKTNIKYSFEMTQEELTTMFENVDILVFNSCSDKRVDLLIPKAKHLVVESEHIYHRSNNFRFLNHLRIGRYFSKHKSWKKMDKTLLALSYFSSDGFEKHGFKDKIYRFGYFPVIEKIDELKEDKKLLWVGDLCKATNPFEAVYALSIFKQFNKDYVLDMVGSGPYKNKILKYAKKLKVNDSINIIENISADEISHKIAKAEVNLFTASRSVKANNILAQMLLNGGIVFANTNASSTLYMANKRNSFIYNNKKKLKKKIGLYCSMDENIIESIKKNAVSTIEEEWNYKVAAKRLFELFSSIVKKETRFTKYENGPISKHQEYAKRHIADETNINKIEKKSKKNIALGTVFGIATVGLAVLSGLVLIPWIIDTIGQEMYGVYGLATSLIALFMIDLGLTTTTNTYLAKLRAKNDKNGVEKFLATIFKLYLLLDLIFLVVIIVLYFLIDKIYIAYTPAEREALKPVLLIIGGYSLINFPTTAFTGAITAYEKFGWAKFCEFANKLLYFVLTIVAINVGWGLIGLVTVNAVAGIVAILMRYFYMRYYMGIRLRLFSKVDKGTIREIAKFSSWALVLGICGRLIFNITPSILGIVCKNGTGADECAIFAVISTIEGYIYILGTIMSNFFMAKIARTEEETEEDKKRHLLDLAQKVGKLQFVLIAMIVIGYVTVGQEFLAVWMNRNDYFTQAIYYGIILLCVSEIINIPELIFDQAMYTEGHIKPLAINSIVKASINLGLSFWLSREYGALGACIAIACARCVNVVMNNIAYKKYLKLDMAKYFSKIYIRGSITFILSLGVGLAMHFFIPIMDWRVKVLVNGFAFVVVYLLLTFFVTFNVEERYFYLDAILKLIGKNKQKKTKLPGQKKKILQFVGYMHGGGVESFVMSYFRQFYDQFDFTFAVFEGSTKIPEEEITRLGGKIVIIPHIKHYFKFKKALDNLFKNEYFDIVHSHINTLGMFPLKEAARYGVPVRIAHSHSTSSKKEVLRNIVKNIFKLYSKSYSTHYFACSKNAAIFQFGKRSFKKGEVKILHNAIDIERFKFDQSARDEIRAKLNVNDDEILIGNFGRLVVTKNQTFILDLAEKVLQKSPKIKFLIAGSGELEGKIKSIIATKKLANVILLPNTDDINKYYSALDIFMLPSLYEGLGLTAIEAEANGLYCLLSNKVPLETLVSGYGKYLPINKKSVPEWLRLIDNKYERKDFTLMLKQAGYEIVSSAVELANIYTQLS